MDNENIECVSISDGMEDEEEVNSSLTPQMTHQQFSSKNINVGNNINGLPPATSVHELLECPVCTNSMYPPIHQNKVFVDQLSTVLPALTCTKFPCFSRLPYQVPSLGSHLVLLILLLQKQSVFDFCRPGFTTVNPRFNTLVFHCFGQYFCLHFEAFQLGMAPVYMAFLRFMGDEEDARNYSYSLEVGANGRKLTWEGTPRSIRDSHRKVRDSHDGLIIQRNMALFFSGGDRKELKLRVTGKIWKEQNSEGGVCIPNLCS
ncbi:Seven-in-absentia protein, sina [Artemisia annua]|uniref:Seven-in-absentia protein, sina n=1 Tax=Artemisia annua TaxID=35608 RepID=A0A2U1Q112_ARTAN|nr:Seven-in-absentia protein, sina [Artemisia annua]